MSERERGAEQEPLRVERTAEVTMLRLSGARGNALSPQLVDRLTAEVRSAPTELPLLLTSAGQHFCVGLDLRAGLDTDEQLREQFLRLQTLLDAVLAHPAPTIAVVTGAVVGAGADLALSCDLRFGDPTCRWQFPGVEFGVLLGTQRLLSIAGPGALHWLLGRETLQAEEAQRHGLLTWLGDDPTAAAHRLCGSMTRLPPRVLAGPARVLRSPAPPTPKELLGWSLEPPGLAELVHRRARSVGVVPESDSGDPR